jgi:SagB-type dehydrogenase family enzyme
LASRRSVRDFADAELSLEDTAQLLWAAQGITHSEGLRTAPSAGALYPLEVYLVAGRVATLPAGIYRYDPRRHQLAPTASGDRRRELALAALDQTWIADALAVVVIAAVFRRMGVKYGGRGERYVHIEAGHAAENVCLQAVALGLGTTVVGAFSDAEVKRLLGLGNEEPLLLIPVGKPG